MAAGVFKPVGNPTTARPGGWKGGPQSALPGKGHGPGAPEHCIGLFRAMNHGFSHFIPSRVSGLCPFEEKSPGTGGTEKNRTGAVQRTASGSEGTRALRGRSRSVLHANRPICLFFLCLEIQLVLFFDVGGPPSTDTASVETGLKHDRGAYLYNAVGGRGANALDFRAGDGW